MEWDLFSGGGFNPPTKSLGFYQLDSVLLVGMCGAWCSWRLSQRFWSAKMASFSFLMETGSSYSFSYSFLFICSSKECPVKGHSCWYFSPKEHANNWAQL